MQFIEGVIARCQNCLTDEQLYLIEEMKLCVFFSYVLNEFFTFYLLNIYYSFTS